MTPVFLGKFPNKKLPHFCGENSPLAVPRVVDAWHFAWLNSDLRRVKRNHPEKVPASLEDPPNNNKTHGFFRQEIAIDIFPRISFHLKIREVRGWCVPQLDPTGVLFFFCSNWEVRGYMFLHWLYCWHVKKSQEKGNRKWVMYNIIWKKESFFEIPQKTHQTLSIWKAQKKNIWTKR